MVAIGNELARKFCKMFCGEKLCFAKCHAVFIYERNGKLGRAYALECENFEGVGLENKEA